MKPEHRTLFTQFIVFFVVGSLAFVVDIGVLSLLLWAGLPAIPARIPAVILAIATTWALNRKFTFRTKTPPRFGEFAKYFSAMLLGLSVNLGVYAALVWLSPAMQAFPQAAALLGVLAGMVVNFITSRRILGGDDPRR